MDVAELNDDNADVLETFLLEEVWVSFSGDDDDDELMTLMIMIIISMWHPHRCLQ